VTAGSGRGFRLKTAEPGISLLTIDNPDRLNALSVASKRDLLETLTQLQMDRTARVLVITGSGQAFCAGDDIKGDYRDGAAHLVPQIEAGHDTPIRTYDALRSLSQALNLALRNFSAPTIAAVNGAAIQSGLSLALACDFRIASSAARLGSATLRYGLLPDEGGHHLLVQTLGLPRAMDFLMRSRIVSAHDALDIGLVHDVVEPEELMPTALALAAELANGPQVAMRLLKQAVYRAAESTFAQSLDDIALRAAVSDHDHDAAEGLAAFAERRPPNFASSPGSRAPEHAS
jgi:2-(1,2-epoxy-1,2-dihydrophenyl)acetyl-CoA isomerase